MKTDRCFVDFPRRQRRRKLSEGYWLRVQARFDTETAKDALSAQIAKITPWPGIPAHA
ncbi:MAG: hypothetical protein LBM17_09200 [Candidatus Accumulibacter sp.]|jgi:hypothetical protein|nr:hypothetical protein [Accumulibacter sp.]